MAVPQIPNLNSLLGPRSAGRGRGRGMSRPAASSEEEKAAHDKIVQQTDQDASISRLSAVEVGYLDDPFAKYFVPEEKNKRRLPIINRGTYVRTKAIDNLVERFIDKNTSQKKQIISLGAGTDTRFFRLMTRQPNKLEIGYDSPNILYHELDFPENMIRKLDPVYKRSEFCGHCKAPRGFSSSTSRGAMDLDDDRESLYSQTYCAHPVDLRTLDSNRTPPVSFEHIDTTLPTIIISECCLCYLAPAVADTVALYFTQHFFPPSTPLGFIIYEPINPGDAFGKVMVSNLASRGIVLQTLKMYGSLEAQAARMKSYGLEETGGADINELWKNGVDEKEKERVGGLEMLDEVEEWELLAAHYAVVWGWRGEGNVWKDPIDVNEQFRDRGL